jgi:hypothetical protein
MEKKIKGNVRNSGKEAFKNITQKKFLYIIVVLLVIISGFLLFNQISYLNSVYDDDSKIKKIDEKVN